MQTIEEAVDQYTRAWNAKGVKDIQAALKDCWTAQSTYIDTQNSLVLGFDGIANLINVFHERSAGQSIKQLSIVDYHHNSGRFKWNNTQTNGNTMEGMDYFEFNELNQITRIVGFFGPFVDL